MYIPSHPPPSADHSVPAANRHAPSDHVMVLLARVVPETRLPLIGHLLVASFAPQRHDFLAIFRMQRILPSEIPMLFPRLSCVKLPRWLRCHKSALWISGPNNRRRR